MLPASLQGLCARLVRLTDGGCRRQAVGRDSYSEGGFPAGLLMPRKEVSITILLIAILRRGGVIEVPFHRVVEMLKKMEKSDVYVQHSA